MENILNTGDLATLKQGQTLLVSAAQTFSEESSKIRLEFAEIIQDTEVSILQMLNQSDDRFKRGARRVWMTAEPQDASKFFGVDLTNVDEYINKEIGKDYNGDPRFADVKDLNILNPTINGQRVRVQITEQTTPAPGWEENNQERAAKRRGKNGSFVTHNGGYIFTKTDLVLNEPKHTFLNPDPVNTPVSTNNTFETVDTDTGEIFS